MLLLVVLPAAAILLPATLPVTAAKTPPPKPITRINTAAPLAGGASGPTVNLELRNESLTSTHVQNGTLSLDDFAPDTKLQLRGERGLPGSQGAQGVQGIQGIQGPRGIRGPSANEDGPGRGGLLGQPRPVGLFLPVARRIERAFILAVNNRGLGFYTVVLSDGSVSWVLSGPDGTVEVGRQGQVMPGGGGELYDIPIKDDYKPILTDSGKLYFTATVTGGAGRAVYGWDGALFEIATSSFTDFNNYQDCWLVQVDAAERAVFVQLDGVSLGESTSQQKVFRDP
jgi:hypothetical protein